MSAQNQNDIYEFIKDKFVKLLGDDISEYELTMIKNSIGVVYRDVPTSKAILGDRIAEITRIKSDINYIKMRLNDKKKVILLNYTPKYNKLFTVYTRQGRPSKLAIECEIFYTDPDMKADRDRLDEFDELVEFLNNQLSILDMLIRNMESRRYDL